MAKGQSNFVSYYHKSINFSFTYIQIYFIALYAKYDCMTCKNKQWYTMAKDICDMEMKQMTVTLYNKVQLVNFNSCIN